MSLIERAIAKLKAEGPADPELVPPTPPAVAGRDVRSQAPVRIAPTPVQSPFTPLRADAPDMPPTVPLRLGTTLEISRELLEANSFAAPDGAATRIAQEFRQIKRSLVNNALGRSAAPLPHARRIMVTSARAGEGKTFCAINLAISIAAERDLKVLLIDGDVARPSVFSRLGLVAGPGLVDWLQGDADAPDDLVHPTDIPGLSLMSQGTVSAYATELLSSTVTEQRLACLDRLLNDHIVVFDSSPLLLTTESVALSHHMGQIVMVVEANNTTRRMVEDAGNLLNGHQAIGYVLNKQSDEGRAAAYDYGRYGYRAA